MSLWSDAETFSVFGTEVYAFGCYTALGALAALAVICLRSRSRGYPRETGLLTGFLSIILGAVCSRIAFCLMNQELGDLMPFKSWLQISGGGWSMMGTVAGVFLAAFLSARLCGVSAAGTLDTVSLALPLFMAFERAGEWMIPDFDISRPLDSEFLSHTFLAVSDEYGAYLATWRLAAGAGVCLFVILLLADRSRKNREGNLCNLFLLLFGAGAIVLESLRYDRFLSITFVGLQQILAACCLGAGVFAAIARGKGKSAGLKRAAAAALVLTVGIVLGLEFALDRTTFNKFVIYGAMILTVLCPVALSMRLLPARNRE